MISVCIPIYNCNAYPLARKVSGLAATLEADIEIVCIDDNSSSSFAAQNKGLEEVATYVQLSEHIGPARLKNLFLKYAKGDYLLFVDSNAQVDDSFLKNYMRILAKKPQVVVGGVSYDRRGDNDDEHRLHYLYGSCFEEHTADERRDKPYSHFTSKNFVISRELFEQVPFSNVSDTQGNEDYLFAYRLMQRAVPLIHINNAVVIGHLEGNEEFLNNLFEKTKGLVTLYDSMWEDQGFCKTVPLLNRYNRLRRTGMMRLYYLYFKMFKNTIEGHFATGNAINIGQLKLYSLGIFIKYLHYNNQTR